MPDIDSIRPSPRVNSNSSQTRQSTSPRASTASLAAAATVNAGFHNEDSRRSSNNSNGGRGPPPQLVGERRRSSAYLTSHDPTLPGPGEFQLDRSIMNFPYRTASPQGPGSPTMAPRFRDRAPSLGELHQELEEEQEGQVVRRMPLLVTKVPFRADTCRLCRMFCWNRSATCNIGLTQHSNRHETCPWVARQSPITSLRLLSVRLTIHTLDINHHQTSILITLQSCPSTHARVL